MEQKGKSLNFKESWPTIKKIGPFVVGVATILALAIAWSQLQEQRAGSDAQDAANGTMISIMSEQLNLQKERETLEYNSSSVQGPIATENAQKIIEIQQTEGALANAFQFAASTGTAVVNNLPPAQAKIQQTLTPKVKTELPPQSTVLNQPFQGLLFGDNGSLSPDWTWSPGKSSESAYRLTSEGKSIILISGPGTDYWGGSTTGPCIEYPLSGDFTVTIKVDFSGVERYQMAGIGFRSNDNRGSWISLRRISGGRDTQFVDIVHTENNNSVTVAYIPYAKPDLYMRTTRVDEKFTLQISEEGRNWFTVLSQYNFVLPDNLIAFIYVASTTGHGVLSNFSNLSISSTPTQIPAGKSGMIAISGDDPNQLNENFGWYPGGSSASAMRVTNQFVTIISGPATNFWGNDNNAPRIEYPVTDNFVSEIKMTFNGAERWQVGGFGLRSDEGTENWILIRRVSGGGDNQLVEAVRNYNNNTETIKSINYTEDVIYFKIQREEPLISLYISRDGTSWEPLVEGFVMGFPQTNYLFFITYSTSSRGIQAQFESFSVDPM